MKQTTMSYPCQDPVLSAGPASWPSLEHAPGIPAPASAPSWLPPAHGSSQPPVAGWIPHGPGPGPGPGSPPARTPPPCSGCSGGCRPHLQIDRA